MTDKNNLVAFIDFEMNTNGDMRKDDMEIIEYGLVITDGKTYETHRGFVRPITSDHIFDYATFVTGIRNDALGHADTFNRMVSKLSYLTKDCKAIYYWGDFDKDCLNNCADKSPYCNYHNLNNVTRKMQCFQKKYLGLKAKSMRLIDFAKESKAVREDYEQKHRALPDAIMLYKVYKKIVK